MGPEAGVPSSKKVSAVEWVAVLVDAFGFSHSEIMKMGFRTFLAYQRLAYTRNVNESLSNRRARQLGV